MSKAKSKSEQSKKEGVKVAVGLTAAVVTAVGAYFLYGSKSANKNRQAVKSWVLKAKAEVLEKLEEAKEMTQEQYEEVVQNVATGYSELKSASRPEIKRFKEEMLEHWKSIEKLTKPKKTAKSKAVKTISKAISKLPIKSEKK